MRRLSQGTAATFQAQTAQQKEGSEADWLEVAIVLRLMTSKKGIWNRDSHLKAWVFLPPVVTFASGASKRSACASHDLAGVSAMACTMAQLAGRSCKWFLLQEYHEVANNHRSLPEASL